MSWTVEVQREYEAVDPLGYGSTPHMLMGYTKVVFLRDGVESVPTRADWATDLHRYFQYMLYHSIKGYYGR